MKYILEEYVLNEFNASSKARQDVSYFVLQNGFISIGKNDKTKIRNNKIAKSLLALRLFCRIAKLGKNDVLFVQVSFTLLKYILTIKRFRKFKIIYLIHDLFSLRYSTPESITAHQAEITKDVDILSQCTIVVAHNPIMIDKLKQFGCAAKLLSLDIFDYYTTGKPINRTYPHGEVWKVTFAGYLPKSKFLQKIDSAKHDYEMIVYGGPAVSFKTNNYKGTVAPDILPSVIEGHFGLIWEGSYDVSYDNNYTRINNPHKLSMYIVAGLPVIAWSKSAAGKFVVDNQIGLTIDSLDEIDSRLKQLSEADYTLFVSNTLKMRGKLIDGCHVRNVLELCD